jgi:hypothetical protein
MAKSWTDAVGIPTGVFGEVLSSGIRIAEENRATGWEFRRAGIETLRKMCRDNYQLKGVRATVFGVHDGPDTIKYAIFVQDNFLTEVGDGA